MAVDNFKIYAAISCACMLSVIRDSARAQSPLSNLEDTISPVQYANSTTLSGPQKLTPFGPFPLHSRDDRYTLKVASLSGLRSDIAESADYVPFHTAHMREAACVESGYLKFSRQRSENMTCAFRRAREERDQIDARIGTDYGSENMDAVNARGAEFASVARK